MGHSQFGHSNAFRAHAAVSIAALAVLRSSLASFGSDRAGWAEYTPVRLGCELRGVHVAVGIPHGPVRPSQVLLIKNRHLSRIRELGQLRGYVHIATASQALRFVRFRTSFLTLYAWHGMEMEVLTPAQFVTLPNFASLNRSDRRWMYDETGNGDLAVISPGAFSLGHFTPAHVTQSSNGFVVSRWILTFSFLEGYIMEFIEEHVGHDGSYIATVVSTGPAPKLPGIRWIMPGLK